MTWEHMVRLAGTLCQPRLLAFNEIAYHPLLTQSAVMSLVWGLSDLCHLAQQGGLLAHEDCIDNANHVV